MRARLKDVAELAGVQPSTASLVLNEHPKAKTFTPAVRKRIENAAQELGYRPNAVARALVTKRTSCIGFIVPEYVAQRWSNPYYAEFLNGIDAACSRHNYSVIAHCCNVENAVDFAFPRGVTGRSVDGLIVTNWLSPDVEDRFAELDIPCVRVGFTVKGDGGRFPAYGPDVLSGRLLVLEYLAKLGHTDVAFLNSGTPSTHDVAERLEARFRQTPLAASMRLHAIYTPDGRCDASAAPLFFSHYFSLPEPRRPSVLVTNHQTCLGILREMRKYCLDCPGDLSLVSNFDFEAFDAISPGITALKYDNAAVGAYAAERLLGMIDGNPAEPLPAPDFRMTLEIRQSCARRA